MAAVAATLATAAMARQAGAAGDGGLSRLRETPEGRAISPDLVFQDAEGRETRFDAFRGRGLIVNFWATWCPPCVAEMPALDRTHAALARDGIEVLALSSDRGGRAQVEPFYQRTGLRHLAMWFDPRGATGRAFGIRGLPTTIILDRRGMEVARLEGEAEWDRPEMLAAIRRLVRGATPTTNST
ncbi:TlpA disulfide reductase family protein [Falsiroseomonas oryziterrae]|uniref:TlpA disulfide reductase family protein n=1 Tax=Falsiroseomonas oryziterrae TaxID=2911368 RepID=UPI001F2C7585|nr:TlpA disulfide reductase family protein [Roseomonas sp. NPKOSM-4]